MLDSAIHYKEGMKIQKVDVWGEYDHAKSERISKGMIVARYGEKCPYFNDILQYKSVTILCDLNQESEVEYWIMYVMGGGSSMRIELPNSKVALRADYQCW